MLLVQTSYIANYSSNSLDDAQIDYFNMGLEFLPEHCSRQIKQFYIDMFFSSSVEPREEFFYVLERTTRNAMTTTTITARTATELVQLQTKSFVHLYHYLALQVEVLLLVVQLVELQHDGDEDADPAEFTKRACKLYKPFVPQSSEVLSPRPI